MQAVKIKPNNKNKTNYYENLDEKKCLIISFFGK